MPNIEGVRLNAKSQVSTEIGDLITALGGDQSSKIMRLYGITVGRADNHSSP